jgi:hypothetical protein
MQIEALILFKSTSQDDIFTSTSEAKYQMIELMHIW